MEKLEYSGIQKVNPEVQLFTYDSNTLSEYQKFDVLNLEKHVDLQKTNWLNIHGLNDIEILKIISDHFDIDNFILSDILNTGRRTKVEEQEDALFFSIKSLLPIEDSDNINTEQISFFIKNGILISFQEKKSDFFTGIRERIRTQSGVVRMKKVDYLLYLLLDAVMENFYTTIENEEEKIEQLIELTKKSTDPIILQKIGKHRSNFNFLKRSIIPLRDSLYEIKSTKDDDLFNTIEDENFTFFTRLHQKSLELLEKVEFNMGSLESTSNLFFAIQSQKMNEIMKTLTIVSVIFIPLTFIVGLYGMNFKYMPELEYSYGYYTVLTFMFLIFSGMVYYFKRLRWF